MKKILMAIFAFILLGTISCMQPYRGLQKMQFADLKYPFPEQYVKLDRNIRLAYVDQGQGEEPLIFIHGLGSYLPAWKKNLPELSQRYRCIALDLPGYGKSSKGLYPFTMEFYADVIAEFMDKLHLTSATIVGHSMGGQIAMVMALKYPHKVRRLILVSTAGFEQFSEGEKEWFKEVVTPDFVKNTPVQQIRANVVANFYNMPGDAEFMITDRIALREAGDFIYYCYTVAQSVKGMVDQPVYELLERIQQPVLILFGENDNLIPNPILHGGRTRGIARIGQERIPNSKLVLIPRCGHFLQFEKPEVFNKAVMDFMGG